MKPCSPIELSVQVTLIWPQDMPAPELTPPKLVGGGRFVTVTVWAESAQLVAPLDAVQPLPVILAVPVFTPETVVPETEATAELLEAKVPPDQPAGADAKVLVPLIMEAAAKVT